MRVGLWLWCDRAVVQLPSQQRKRARGGGERRPRVKAVLELIQFAMYAEAQCACGLVVTHHTHTHLHGICCVCACRSAEADVDEATLLPLGRLQTELAPLLM